MYLYVLGACALRSHKITSAAFYMSRYRAFGAIGGINASGRALCYRIEQSQSTNEYDCFKNVFRLECIPISFLNFPVLVKQHNLPAVAYKVSKMLEIELKEGAFWNVHNVFYMYALLRKKTKGIYYFLGINS